MRLWLIISDVVCITISWFASYFFFFNEYSPLAALQASGWVLPILYGVRIALFVRMGLYRAILRYASFHFATTIVKAVTISSALCYLIINYPLAKWPAGLLIMDWLVNMLLVGVTRFLPRYYSETNRQEKPGYKKALIYGAGDLGDAVARSMIRSQKEYETIGFIDDDVKKIGKKLHNLPILGNRQSLGRIIKKNQINEIIIAINNSSAEWLRDLIKECRGYDVFCRIAPRLADMLSQDVHIKNIDIVDLLKRDPKDLDEKQIDRFLKRKKILITGAAGSIGSELVRQALRFKPKKLILVDISEYGLYKLEEELRPQIEEMKSFCRFKFALLDVCKRDPLEKLMEHERPEIVFHAAAYKHVPMLESNPFVGLHNNIQGTINMADLSDQIAVEKFVLISTDKAVRPTNVMGASKRICELYIQNLNLRSKAEFVSVRFGNVLGSSGSVIPKFLEQIKNGGPITVTHPKVTRFFMLIQEAVELVMQAASIGHGGEIFILNMGKPVQIKEMAEDLIFLAGKIPYKEIDIKFTGLRPGEKLYEELLIDETEKKTQYENITIGKMTFVEWNSLTSAVNQLMIHAESQDRVKTLQAVQSLVPEFQHVDLPAQIEESNIVHLRPKSS